MPKKKRIAMCVMCGMRIAMATSAFCVVDCKRVGIVKTNLMKHRPHRWVWALRIEVGGIFAVGQMEFL